MAAPTAEPPPRDPRVYLAAERTLLAAQDLLAQARTAAAEAYVNLYRARGGLW